MTWTSSNTAVATVSSTGLVTAVANGSATITATTADGSNKTATCTVTVNIPVPSTGISLSHTSATLTAQGQTLQLSATITPDNATDKSVTWTSSNTAVATVTNTGLVTAVANGSATLTATTADGSNKTATCTVMVSIPIPATGISLNQTSATLTSKGQTVQLTASVTPSNATNKSVTWTSSNLSVATVSNTGLVTAVANGSATITVTTADGSNKTATCAVTVGKPNGINIDGISYIFDPSTKKASVTYTGSEGSLISSYSDGITIPSNVTYNNVNYSVTTIGEYAFNKCSKLTSITIPSSVDSICSNAFYNCSGLTSVTINSNEITSKTYSYNSNIGKIFGNQVEKYILGDNVMIIGPYAFYACKSLTSMTITHNVDSIGKSAFWGCSDLTSVTINSNKLVSKTTLSSTFSSIFGSQVKEYILGDSITSVGEWAFGNSTSLTSITIPKNVTSIGKWAFYYCTKLTSVTIESKMTSIGDYAFYECSCLTSITIPDSLTNIGNGVLYGCSSLTSVTIPNSVKTIGSTAFRNCSSLTSITLPDSLTRIEWETFDGCTSLKSIVIPPGVTHINSYAFNGCSSLTSITCQAVKVPNTGVKCFTDVPISSATLYVPAPSVNAYKSSSPWSDFGTIEDHYLKTPVQNVGELIDRQIYTADTRRAAWYVPVGGTQLLSTVYPTSIDNNQYDSGQQFALIKWDGNIYIYSVGEKKILNGITSNTPNNGVLVTADCQPVTITETGDVDYPLFFSFGENFNLNIGGDNQITIDHWSTLDDGNKVALRPVHGMILDDSEMRIIIGYLGGDIAIYEHYLQTPVQNVGELTNNRQVYTAETKRAAWYVPDGSTQLETTEFPTVVQKNNTSSSQQFAFIQHDGNFYIYCVGEGKILNGKTSNSPNRGILVSEDFQPVTITETGDADYPLFFSYGENFNINVGGDNQITIDHWSTPDDGNKVALRPVQGVMLDENEIAAIISYLEENIPGDANDSGGVEIGDVTAVLTLMANPDAPGYNNKAADANGNGNIEIGDITTILTIMASGE